MYKPPMPLFENEELKMKNEKFAPKSAGAGLLRKFEVKSAEAKPSYSNS